MPLHDLDTAAVPHRPVVRDLGNGTAPEPAARADDRDGTATRGFDRSSLPARTHPALAGLSRIALDQPLGQVLQEVADLATQVLPGVDALSVTLVEQGRARSAAVTHPLAALLDERQYEEGFGPCMDTARSGGVLRVDVADGGRRSSDGAVAYPGFTALARRHGVRSVVAVALPWQGAVVGALNLYSCADEPLGDECVAMAASFAGYAGAALAHASLLRSTTELVGQMRTAMSSRAVIEQAKGVLVAVLGVTPDDAFAELSRRSQRTNTKLRDVAAVVVAEAQEVHERRRARRPV